MKNNTRIRLHLSKSLFESIAKEVLAESKKMNMSGGAYTEAVKMPKQAKKIKEVNAMADTDKMKKMEEVDAVADTKNMRKMFEMSSKEKMAKGLYKEDAGALQPGENITWLDGHQREYKGVIQSQEGGDYYKVKITAAPAGGHKVGDILTKQSGDVKKAMEEMSSKEKMAKGLYKEADMAKLKNAKAKIEKKLAEMEINVAEEDKIEESKKSKSPSLNELRKKTTK